MREKIVSPGVFVSSPDLRPSIVGILEGLSQESLLRGVATTCAFDRSHKRDAVFLRLSPYLPACVRKGSERRMVPDSLSGMVHTYWSHELVRLAVSRIAGPLWANAAWLWSESAFDRWVARSFAGTYSLMYGMEHSSRETFARHKAKGGTCVLRQVMAHGQEVADTILREIMRHPSYASAYHRLFCDDIQRSVRRKEEEYVLSDRIVANSAFVRESFLKRGFPGDRIVAVPTGFPQCPHTQARAGSGDGPVRFLYVGNLSLRKGIPYLIKAWNALAAGAHAELILAGPCEIPLRLLRGLQGTWNYAGVLSRLQLYDLYASSDVFVLPTLLEGRSHAVLEAMSSGLPVITTVESGCADDITMCSGGIVVPAAESEQLSEAMQWCLSNRKALRDMGKASHTRALEWTVSDANREHIRLIRDFMK